MTFKIMLKWCEGTLWQALNYTYPKMVPKNLQLIPQTTSSYTAT